MYGVTLQDWISFQDAASSNTIIQVEDDWLDTSGYQDIVLWTQTGSLNVPNPDVVTISFESAPVKDDTAFLSMGSITLSGTTPGVTVTPVLMSTAVGPSSPVPALARWVRWKITTSSVTSLWVASFRIFASLNGPGPVM
jgi:hypothetical protein